MRSSAHRAYARQYRQRWVRHAVRQASALLRRYTVVASLALALVHALLFALFGEQVALGSLALSALASLIAFFIGALMLALLRAPAEIAYSLVSSPGRDLSERVTMFVGSRTCEVSFPTLNHSQRTVRVGAEPTAVRFKDPPRDEVIRDSDLPAVIPVTRKGRVIIESFTDTGIIISEERTAGRMITLDVYMRESPLDQEVEISLNDHD